MFYSIRHLTQFRYDSAVSESLMEARMQPRTDTLQRCLQFTLLTTPSARVMIRAPWAARDLKSVNGCR